MKNSLMLTRDDLEKFMDKDNYLEFCEWIKEKGKFKEGFWLIAEEFKEIKI